MASAQMLVSSQAVPRSFMTLNLSLFVYLISMCLLGPGSYYDKHSSTTLPLICSRDYMKYHAKGSPYF